MCVFVYVVGFSFFLMTANSPICLSLRGGGLGSHPLGGLETVKPISVAEIMPCDFWGYHHKKQLLLGLWNAPLHTPPSLFLLEPRHCSVSSPSHVERSRTSTPVNSPSWAKLPSHPSPGTNRWMKKPPDTSSPQPTESLSLSESSLWSPQTSRSRDKPSPLCSV